MRKRRTRAELEEIAGKMDVEKEVIRNKNSNYNQSVDRINFTVPRGRKEDIQKYCQTRNTSVNAFLADTVLSIVDGKKILTDVTD